MTYRQPENEPKIVEWVDKAPRSSRESVWDAVVAEVRKRPDTDQWCKIERGDTAPSSTWLRKQYPDLEIVIQKRAKYVWMRVKKEADPSDLPPIEMAEMNGGGGGETPS